MGDAINQDWEHDPRVEILHVLDQISQPYSCTEWGDAGLNGVPIIKGEGSSENIVYEGIDDALLEENTHRIVPQIHLEVLKLF